MLNRIKIFKNVYMVFSICFMFVGALMIMLPDDKADEVCIILGALLVLYGIVKLFGYFVKDIYQLAFQFDLALGIFFMIVGIALIKNSAFLTDRIAFVMGCTIVLDSVLKLQTAIDAKRFGIENWWTIVMSALFVFVSGIVLLFIPYDRTGMITNMIGLSLVFDGILNIVVVLNTIYKVKKGAHEA